MNRAVESAASPARGARRMPKILRACVVQGGKVLEEQRLRRRVPLTVGSGPKNIFVIADPNLPKTHELFAVKGGTYELVLTESMRGKVSGEGAPKPVDFASLRAQGLLKKKGPYYHLPLNEGHRGKVVIGDVTIIFQFVVPPPAPAKPQLPAAAKGTLWQRVDWPFATALAVAFALEAPAILALQFIPKPEPVTLETMSNRWAQIIAPELKREKKKPPPKKQKSKTEVAKKKVAKKADPEPVDDAKRAARKAARSKKIREKIAGKGVLAVLGTLGSGKGAVADVFGSGGLGGDLDAAFDGIAGVGLATGRGRTTRGGGSGSAASIGGLATSGGGKVGLGRKAERRVGAVKTEAPEVDGSLDSAAIARVVRARMRMVQDCYERELKRSPNISGKIEIEFTIGTNGRVEEALIASNAMGSAAVGNCIVSRIRRWRFPRPDGGSVTVTFPFIFTSSS